jgi:hypothetical protein
LELTYEKDRSTYDRKRSYSILEKVLKWQAFIQSHQKIKRAIECLLNKKGD